MVGHLDAAPVWHNPFQKLPRLRRVCRDPQRNNYRLLHIDHQAGELPKFLHYRHQPRKLCGNISENQADVVSEGPGQHLVAEI